MWNFPKDTKHEQKCYVTHGKIGHVDPKQPPTKRKPFANILDHQFINKVEMILPKELYDIMENEIFADSRSPVYSRVILPLQTLVEGEFFTEYIKKGNIISAGDDSTCFIPTEAYETSGNILMLSEGRIGVDNVFSLSEGILTLHLDKETYERSGLVGKPEGIKGKREHRPRWIVEFNLRLPSMLKGKKGFDRIVYAFKNVLTTPITWLFCDLGATVLESDPLAPHYPHKVVCSPRILYDIEVKMPLLKPTAETKDNYGADFQEFAVEMHEWLSLVSLDSPRIQSTDKIDPFLSRYTPPGNPDTTDNLVKVTWTGFISPSWAHKTFVQILLAIPRKSWLSYYVGSFGATWDGEGKNSTILKVPDALNEYVLWEVS